MKKQSKIATISIFFAIMLLMHLITSLIFTAYPLPIKPTLIHIPVIVASILYGPRIGMSLGFLMGLMSMITNTVVLQPTSYLFSPFNEQGNLYSLIIAFVPRILIGITPYYIYKAIKGKWGLILAGALGSLTNTCFVLGGIFIFFSQLYQGNIKLLLAAILSTNSLAEMVISTLLVTAIIPRLEKIRK